MAYGPFDRPDQTGRVPAQGDAPLLLRFVNLSAAVISVALVAGLGWWSYQLVVRDISGVPVIRALEGPFRVSPTDPGGRQAAFQGLAVNAVPASGAGSDLPERIVLAPPPVSLSAADRLPTAQPDAGVAEAEAQPPSAVALGTLAAEPAPAGAAPALTQQSAQAAPAHSPFPRPRPAERATGQPISLAQGRSADPMAEAAVNEIASRLAGPRTIDIDPRTLTPGTRLVQFGAYETEAEARDAWATLLQRFPAYLDGHARVIEPAMAGGRVFYRLRAHGFRDEGEARRFCAVFIAENVDCIPVLIR